MSTISLVVTLISTALSVNESRKARKEGVKQTKIRNRIAANKRVRDIKRTIAKSRVDRASAEAAGFQFGVSGGSAVSGATAGIQGDLGGSIGAANQQFTGQQAIAESQNKIAGFEGRSQTFGSIASISGQFIGGDGSQGAQNRAAFSDAFNFGG
jgi:hypothetical protein